MYNVYDVYLFILVVRMNIKFVRIPFFFIEFDDCGNGDRTFNFEERS